MHFQGNLMIRVFSSLLFVVIKYSKQKLIEGIGVYFISHFKVSLWVGVNIQPSSQKVLDPLKLYLQVVCNTQHGC